MTRVVETTPPPISSRHAHSHVERVIGVGGMAGAAINCIVGSGIFGLPGLVAAMLGPTAFLAYLVCAVLVGLVGLCLAEVGSRVDDGGGLYGYAAAAFGPIVGGVAGTLVLVANLTINNAAVANLLLDTLALAFPWSSGGPARLAILAATYGLLVLVNIRGARSGARLSSVLAVVKIAPLVLLVIAGAFHVRVENLQWTAMPAASQVAQAAMLLAFAFMGVEGGLYVSGEATNPSRTVPRAIFLALTTVAALYIGLQGVAQGVLGERLSGEAAPLVALASAIFGPRGAQLLFATTLVSVIGYLASDILGGPRVVAALAGRGQLPGALATLHPRFRTPGVAIVVYASVCAAVAWSGSFRQLAVLGTSGTLVLYLICCLGLLRLRARGVAMAGTPFRAPGGAVVPIAASAIIVWLLWSLTWTELGAALALMAASGVFFTWYERRRRTAAGDARAASPLEPGD